MTDKEEFIKFFEKFNIPYHTKEHNYLEGYNENSIIIYANDKSRKVNGYRYFFNEIMFDENNNFVEFGIWE